MTTTATPIFPQALNNALVTIANGDATTVKTLYTAGANGSRIENISVTNTDTSPYTVNVFIKQSATNYLIGTMNVPASAGNTTSAATLNLLGYSGNLGASLNRDSNGNTYLYLASGSTLMVGSTTTVTSAKTLTFVCQGGDY